MCSNICVSVEVILAERNVICANRDILGEIVRNVPALRMEGCVMGKDYVQMGLREMECASVKEGTQVKVNARLRNPMTSNRQ
jgi:hypothetical protein